MLCRSSLPLTVRLAFARARRGKGRGEKKASASTGRIDLVYSLGGGRNCTSLGLSTQLHSSLHHADGQSDFRLNSSGGPRQPQASARQEETLPKAKPVHQP